ncbi:hypothetical protein A3D07_04250 [Candidatus Curtissbacteria bacterium RIFCSPHIGHO2_02_FULL_42_15]|uniref:Type II toxin-antitoxin system mRNA interferase toxin, RelE/StbE family n=1 Tax=Candidatus Curtissbacteria bacterium RIFCSPHIGHO2_02_FULL_42_15 TaxID=1797716 RepID=A0A1F5GGN7_9BACT|nr:MAG: hypothetical protein A3D07_04250 [Candidatus Curtissbacteria bacterium RIFCSPHIGHO2_02_FULL_42_15]
MTIVFHRDFKKKYHKLSPKIVKKLDDRLSLFSKDEFNPVLNNHALKGKWLGYRSINVTGDMRAIFKRDSESALFVIIDSHSNLYR